MFERKNVIIGIIVGLFAICMILLSNSDKKRAYCQYYDSKFEIIDNRNFLSSGTIKITYPQYGINNNETDYLTFYSGWTILKKGRHRDYYSEEAFYREFNRKIINDEFISCYFNKKRMLYTIKFEKIVIQNIKITRNIVIIVLAFWIIINFIM